jgi:hypothetical protein
LEQEATALSFFHSSVIPGLLQTPDYTRALHSSAVPVLENSAVEERVEERRRRQRILSPEDPPQVEVVLDEAVLHRPVGGPVVMSEQLTHLVEEAGRSNVTVQVVPFGAGAHPALENNFTILEFDGPVPPVVYVEGLAGPMYLERQQDVERYELVLEMLRGAALSPQDSAGLVAKVRDMVPTN